jgi:hypothetical protein
VDGRKAIAMTALKWKRHDSFEAQGDGETYYVSWEGDCYTILLRWLDRRGRTKWQHYGRRETIEEAKQFCEEAYASHMKKAAA